MCVCVCLCVCVCARLFVVELDLIKESATMEHTDILNKKVHNNIYFSEVYFLELSSISRQSTRSFYHRAYR